MSQNSNIENDPTLEFLPVDTRFDPPKVERITELKCPKQYEGTILERPFTLENMFYTDDKGERHQITLVDLDLIAEHADLEAKHGYTLV